MKTLGLAMQRIGAAVNKGLWGGLVACLMVFQGAAYGAERVVYYHHDALGSPIAATDESGAVIWREEYQPHGERLLRQDGGTNRLWFTGKPEEERLGISYFGARWYDPTIGQFLGVDPVSPQEGNPHSFNRYAYANNNPYRYIDPDGRWAETALDALSLGMSLAAFKAEPSCWNGVGLAYDAVATAAPFLPAVFGIAKNLGKGVEAIAAADKGGDVAKSTSKELTTFFPPNSGFLGTPTNTTLQPGQIIDRFGGSEVSRFFSPAGTPAAMRALPPGTESQPLRTFEVLKPIDVQSGQVAPAFNQIGLGTQFRSNQQLGELSKQGFLREITK